MLFNSCQFPVFFFAVIGLYFSIAHRFRWALLLAASCYFYMVLIPRYLLILLVLILVDYAAGLLIEGAQGPRRKALLIMSLIANIGMLAVFKYFHFFGANLEAIGRLLGLHLSAPQLIMVLPIGLSFHTFQSMSYTIEVYRGNQRAERHLGVYALYVMFFPQLVAGPIERPQHLLHQFHEEKFFDYQRVADGFKLMAWGMFQKVVVADRLAVLVNSVYAEPASRGGAELALATYAFAFQIYCDFAGYSDIAVGAAQVLGIALMRNFNRPYFADSVAEFWKRWHISLSTWFRDYLYIPLGGSRVSRPAWYFNLFFVFLVSGFWHGANWTFVFWGGLHGFYLVAAIMTEGLRRRAARACGLDARPNLLRALSVFLTFHLATFAWIAFRARGLQETLAIMGKVLDAPHWGRLGDLGMGAGDLALACAAVAALLAVHSLQTRGSVLRMLAAKPPLVRCAAYAALLLAILVFGQFKSQSFIYFQF